MGNVVTLSRELQIGYGRESSQLIVYINNFLCDIKEGYEFYLAHWLLPFQGNLLIIEYWNCGKIFEELSY